MDRNTLIIGLVAVLVLFGGIVAYDIFTRTESGSSSNWLWSDNWGEPGSNPQPQPQPEIPKETDPLEAPRDQLTAGTYEEALKKAEEHSMPVLIFFEADWCVWCKKMKKDTIQSDKQEIKDALKHYVLVYVNIDKNRNVARRYNVSVLPSYVITNCNQTLLKSGRGYQNVNDFADWLNNPEFYKQPKK